MDAESNLLDRYWRAANYLTVGQIYLRGNPLVRERSDRGPHQAPAARTLGHIAGTELRLRAPQPTHPRARRERDLHRGPGSRRSGARRQRVSGGHVHRDLPRRHRERGRHAAPLPAVLDAGWHSEPRERRRRPGRSTKAASSDTRWCTPSARRSTTPISSSRASSVTGKPRPDRSRARGRACGS